MLGLGFFCQRYGQRGLVAAPGSLPAARAAAWFVNWAWQIPGAGLAFVLLLFPTGRLCSPRWRPAAWFVAVVFTMDAAAQVVHACLLWTDPFAAPGAGWYPGLRTAILILVPVALLTGAAAVTVRFAQSSGEERLQLKWFAMAALLVIAAIIPLALAPQIGLSPAAESEAVTALKVAFGLALVCLYAAIAVAVLKYRLYDIDRVISRTLAYAIVTGVLAGVYAGLVLLATGVFRVHSPVAVAAATLAAAALFAPVRRRVQRRVDRRFNRARYDADQTVAAFAARLKDAVDLDTVREDLARVVQTGTGTRPRLRLDQPTRMSQSAIARAAMVDRWRRSSSSKSPSTAQSLSASLVSGARCWGTSYRRRRRGLLLGTISIARCRLSIRVQRSHALIPPVWARDCTSSAFPNARSSRIGCILTCGSVPGSWVKSAWPHLRPNAHGWSRSARYACGYCLPMTTTSRAS